MRESMPGCLDVGPDEERETVHAHDAYTGTGWNRSIAVIAHGPEGAAVLGWQLSAAARETRSVITLPAGPV